MSSHTVLSAVDKRNLLRKAITFNCFPIVQQLVEFYKTPINRGGNNSPLKFSRVKGHLQIAEYLESVQRAENLLKLESKKKTFKKSR
jgi:hypothetical protein